MLLRRFFNKCSDRFCQPFAFNPHASTAQVCRIRRFLPISLLLNVLPSVAKYPRSRPPISVPIFHLNFMFFSGTAPGSYFSLFFRILSGNTRFWCLRRTPWASKWRPKSVQFRKNTWKKTFMRTLMGVFGAAWRPKARRRSPNAAEGTPC